MSKYSEKEFEIQNFLSKYSEREYEMSNPSP
jgi:hypothetical protein